ncbi:MAG: GNAT family N-acetyltransferase [Pseudomonadota bacterium]
MRNSIINTPIAVARPVVTVRKAALGDIAPVFNLIQQCSAAGLFNAIYLEPRFQAGLGLQLFTVVLFGKIRLPGGNWSRAGLHVVCSDGVFAGFALMRDLHPSGRRREIYLAAVQADMRRQGLGRSLILSILEQLEAGISIDAECQPCAGPMKHLLRSIGFSMHKPAGARAFTGGARVFTMQTGSRLAD